MPTTTESMPSSPNSHCQPCRPSPPSSASSGPESGPEIAAATDEPATNSAVARPR
ncbi:Uncharacterised protein [Mycobacteroides abscessus subsp. abscessus]|nr:Uncharacterised protein [Mycobacteroides abscessus subsp. abscessus]